MNRNDLSGKVQTVLGPIEPEDLGITLTHEHLLIDLGAPTSRCLKRPAGELIFTPP